MIHAAEGIHMIRRQNVSYRLRNAENVNFSSSNKKACKYFIINHETPRKCAVLGLKL